MVKGFRRSKGVGPKKDRRGKENNKPRRREHVHSINTFERYTARDAAIRRHIVNAGGAKYLDDYYNAREDSRSDPSAMEEMLSGIENPGHKQLYERLCKNYQAYVKSQKG